MATCWGILGAGDISHDFALALQLLPATEHKVVCVAARDLKRAQDFANDEDHKIAKAYGAYQDLASDQNVDVVYIGNSHPHHLDAAKLMLNAGKAVLCEKPLTMNLRQSEELIAVAKQEGKFLMEGIWSRFFPIYTKIREEVTNGTIGDAMHVSVKFMHKIAWKPRMSDKAQGGGCVLNYGLYAIQFVLWVFQDEPEEVKAQGIVNETGAEDACTISMKFSSGRTANIYLDSRLNGDSESIIYGTNGKLEALPQCIKPVKLVTPSGTLDYPVPRTEAKTNFLHTMGFTYQAQCIRECLQKGLLECPTMTHQDSLLLSSLVDNVRQQIGVDTAVSVTSSRY
ncbi:trans-1,2-dihydrobenzene-1,2-diol dehydrogenase-like [Lineus longissimus]|uniref:trans-1,2-dihydrobenzene-1,2-diol dehydrogenase-like n=1 Tax=Lineus longissimus TaxID=88925 RepID=UPI002B4CB824